MNTTQPAFVNPLPHVMRWGALLGIMFSANFICGSSSSIILQALTYVLIVVILFTTWHLVCNFRDKESKGVITFYRAFSYIMMLYFFAALVSAIVKLIYLKINPDYLSQLIATTEQLLLQMQIEQPVEYQQTLTSMLNPANFVLQVTMFNTLIGAIIGLVFAPFITKKSNKNIDSEK